MPYDGDISLLRGVNTRAPDISPLILLISLSISFFN
jgi:hypothetical protein